MKKQRKVALTLAFAIVLTTIGSDSGMVYAATGDPTATIAESTEEHANFNSAMELPANTTVTGKTNYYNLDYYKYITTEEGYFYIKGVVTNDVGSLGVEIFDSEMNKVCSTLVWDEGGISQGLNAKKGALFYIKLDSTAGVNDFTEYSICAIETAVSNMEKEKNNTTSKANKISLNKTHHGIILNHDDKDYFKFKAPSAGTYKFTFDYETGNELGSGWSFYLQKKNGDEIKGKKPVKGKTTLSKKMKAGETVYVLVWDGFGYGASEAYGYLYSIKVKKK